jgi:hypothetical protein
LIVDTPDQPTVLAGALERLDAQGWAFRTTTRLLSGGLDQAAAVVLASPNPPGSPPPAMVHTLDGDQWPGELRGATAEGFQLALPGGATIEASWERAAEVRLRSPRVLYLSDADPVESVDEGFFGARWAWRRDQCANGGPLQIAGQQYSRGLGVHSYSRLTFDRPAGFDRLIAAVGIDDAAPPHGAVVFRVLADGSTVWVSPLVRRGQAALPVAVDLPACRRFSLVAEFGDGLDLGDLADWGEARIVRMSPTRTPLKPP